MRVLVCITFHFIGGFASGHFYSLIKTKEAIKIANAQALLIETSALEEARQNNDVVPAQEILQQAFRTDVRRLAA